MDAMTVAVTGVTGTVGRSLMTRLEADPAVERVIGIGSGPLGPDARGAGKLDYRRVDIRDELVLREALRGADVVVHLAFSFYGVRQPEPELRDVNVRGTLAAYAAARRAGAKRFVYTSSAAVYGFHGEGADPVREDAPLRPEREHFYSLHKAELERRLRAAERRGGPELTIFRPCGVVGPDAAGGALRSWPAPLRAAAPRLLSLLAAAGLRPALPAPGVVLQAVHQDDVAQAIHLAVRGEGLPGTYNLAGDGALSGGELLSELGLRAIPVPGFAARTGADLVARAARGPLRPAALQWAVALRGSLVLDTTRAREQLGWTPRWTSRAALIDTRVAAGL